MYPYILFKRVSCVYYHRICQQLLDKVKKLAAELGEEDCVVSAIRFDFIVPTHAEFSFGEITGRLCEWRAVSGRTRQLLRRTLTASLW